MCILTKIFRYKCLSEYTWPNFRGGSMREAVEIIVKQQNLTSKCAFGMTQVFLKDSATLAVFEDKRQQVLPHLIVFLQKVYLYEYFCNNLEDSLMNNS